MNDMSLDQALAYLQVTHLPLHYCERRGLGIWASQARLPSAVRQVVVKHRQHILELMSQADIRVCPAREYHRPYWKHTGAGRYVCEVCQHLEKWMGQKTG